MLMNEVLLTTTNEHVSDFKDLDRSKIKILRFCRHMRFDCLLAGAFLTSSDLYSSPRTGTLQIIKMSVEKRLEDLGIKLPPAPKAAANYAPVLRQGDMLYLSGHLPMKEDGSLMTGRLGEGKDVEFGYSAARQVGLNLLSSLTEELGSLDHVEQIVKLFGIVQSTNEFHDQHKVVNGTCG